MRLIQRVAHGAAHDGGLLYCSLGDHYLPADAFHRNASSPTGYCYSCKEHTRQRRRIRLGITKRRSVRRRENIGGIAYLSCLTGHMRPLSEFSTAKDKRGHTRTNSYCRQCATKRRSDLHNKRLIAELSAPKGTATPLLDALAAAETRRTARNLEKRRERRALLLGVAQGYIHRLRAAGWTWLRLGDVAGLHKKTPRDWADSRVTRLPTRPALERAIAAWALAEERILLAGSAYVQGTPDGTPINERRNKSL